MDASWCSKCGALSTGKSAIEEPNLSATPGTRHYTLLNSNELPEDSDSTFIRSVISKTDAYLASLDDEISKLQEKLRQLEDERASLANYRTRNAAILSPIRRMPPEVLGEIFLWTLPAIDDILRVGRFDMSRSPWLLTRISGRWRAVSVSNPLLWCCITIDYSPNPAFRLPYYSLALVKAQIQRAQQLKIHFYGCPDVDFGPQNQIFALLLQHSLRWEELAVGITVEMLPLLAALRNRVSSLKRLWIQWEGRESQTTAGAFDSFQAAPSLVDFGSAGRAYLFFPQIFPLHQLSRLDLGGAWVTLQGILKLTPNVVEVNVKVSHPWPDFSEPIELLHLRRLYVSHPRALDYLKAPAMEGLAFLVNRKDMGNDTLDHLESFLGRSACILRKLCLRRPNAHILTQILEKFASITELVLVVKKFDHTEESIDLMMARLTFEAGSTMIAPQLRSFVLGCEGGDPINPKTYLEMLESRWGAEGSALEKAALLVEHHGLHPETLRGLEALRQDGLTISTVSGVGVSGELSRLHYGPTWVL